jgi:iron complex outermembrane recepter protein
MNTYCPRLGSAPLGDTGLCSPIPKAQFDSVGEDPPDLPLITRPSADVRQQSWREFTPSATLSYIATAGALQRLRMDNFMAYVTYSQGFKAGGFEPRGAELVPFNPETVSNYELGVKMDTLDNRLRLNAALYHMDYEDIQVRIAEQGEAITDIFLFLSNAGEARITGLELEATLLLDNWVFNASGNYTNARYQVFDMQVVDPGSGAITTVDRSDEDFALVPEKSFSLAAQYNWQTAVGLFMPRLAYYYRDRIFIGIDERAAEFRSSYIDSLNLLNARLTWLPSENLRLTAYVDNVLDERYFASGFAVSATLGSASLVRGPQRAFGLEFGYEF